MWIITQYSKGKISMYEFKTEQEAKDKFRTIQGNKILSEVIYYNDPCFI
jgi:ArsR family metal-binding transcriptional regulator